MLVDVPDWYIAAAANRIVAAFEDYYRHVRALDSVPKSTVKIIFRNPCTTRGVSV